MVLNFPHCLKKGRKAGQSRRQLFVCYLYKSAKTHGHKTNMYENRRNFGECRQFFSYLIGWVGGWVGGLAEGADGKGGGWGSITKILARDGVPLGWCHY